MSRLLDAALSYARRGWPVHPLRPADKIPATAHGCKDATTDESRIRAWWRDNPDYNIGLRTGVFWFALDVDSGKHPDAGLWLESAELPDTITAVTGTGGRHFLYAMPEDFVVTNSSGRLPEHIDVRGVGGYIVASPSVHPTTKREYSWDCAEELPTGAPAAAPEWLLDLLRPSPANHAEFNAPPVIGEGGRDNTLYKAACSFRSKFSASYDEIRAMLDGLNLRCAPPLPAKDLDRIARSAAGKPPGVSPQYARPASAETIEPAFEATDEEVPARLKPQALAERLKKVDKFLNHIGVIYRYTGTHWKQIDSGTIRKLAWDLEPKWTDRKRRGEIADHVIDSCRNDTITWRALEKYEVPLANGVIDVRSMSMRSHRAEDYLQTCIPHAYSPVAQCPEWMRCLDTYFGGDDDGEAKGLAIQEFFGYCLMPHATYKKALLCKGESDCGKSTIPFLLRVLVGAENACAVGVEDMDDARKRAPLRGKLVNLLTELTSDAMIADGGFKTLVSTEEPIQFDEKFLPSVMDVPIAKHVIVTNTLPSINDRSRGTFNRLLLVAFNHVIPKKEQDREIWDKLKAEIGGILLWALEGAHRLHHAGGTFTGVGEAEIEEYRADENPVVEFIATACDPEPEGKVLMGDLRKKYSEWLGKNADPRWFARQIKSAGYEITQNPVWVGVRRERAVIGLRML